MCSGFLLIFGISSGGKKHNVMLIHIITFNQADLFSMEEAALRSVAVNAIRIYALSLLFTGLNTLIIYYFQVQERCSARR